MIGKFKRLRTAFAAAAVFAALGTGVVAGAASADAAATQCGGGGCDLFAFGPANGYFFTTPGHAIVGMICWEDASWYDGTNRWFYVSTIYGSGRAWVSANQVINQTVVGHC